MDIQLVNEQDKFEFTDQLQKVIEDVIKATLEHEECDFDAQVSVSIVTNDQIQEINKEHRDIDKPTDVLSFPMLEFDEDGYAIDSDFDMDGDLVMLGDIVISIERAIEQAGEYGHSLKREMAFLTVHSMLHLLGYDHVDYEEGEKLMNQKQEDVLNKLCITRD